MGAGFYQETTTSDRLAEFIYRLLREKPSGNDWFADTNITWGRVADGFIEESRRACARIRELEARLAEKDAEIQRLKDENELMRSYMQRNYACLNPKVSWLTQFTTDYPYMGEKE